MGKRQQGWTYPWRDGDVLRKEMGMQGSSGTLEFQHIVLPLPAELGSYIPAELKMVLPAEQESHLIIYPVKRSKFGKLYGLLNGNVVIQNFDFDRDKILLLDMTGSEISRAEDILKNSNGSGHYGGILLRKSWDDWDGNLYFRDAPDRKKRFLTFENEMKSIPKGYLTTDSTLLGSIWQSERDIFSKWCETLVDSKTP